MNELTRKIESLLFLSNQPVTEISLAEACEGNQGESAAERTLLAKVEEIIERLVAEFGDPFLDWRT